MFHHVFIKIKHRFGGRVSATVCERECDGDDDDVTIVGKFALFAVCCCVCVGDIFIFGFNIRKLHFGASLK
jgi:hypothetical protein